MIKRTNKKGESTDSRSFLIGFALIAGVAILVFLGFNQGWGFITDIFKKADIDTTLIEQKCNSYIEFGTLSGYCYDKIEIGKNKYINCEYAASKHGVKIKGTAPECASDAPAKICKKLKDSEKNFKPEKVEVNGMTCDKWK